MKRTLNTLILLVFTIHLTGQIKNKEVLINNQPPFLIGKIDKNILTGDNYNIWFKNNFDNYTPNFVIIKDISNELKSYDIKLFMGTWCGDSKNEVPKIFKILEACNFPMEQLMTVAVSNDPKMYKQSPEHEELGLNIHRVPTVIFYKNGKEINRIVEHPVKSFEEDIQNIISKNDYKSNYQIVAEIDELLKKKGLKELKKQSKKILKHHDGKVSSMFELNTYSRILLSTDRIREAIEVLTLNTKLFPDQPRTFISLANSLILNGKKAKAIRVLKHAITIHPSNTDLEANFAMIKSN